MPHEATELHTPRLTLFPYTPEQLLTLIEHPERFEQVAALTPAPGLRGSYMSGDVSPHWLAALREAAGQAQGPDPWRFGFWVVEKSTGNFAANDPRVQLIRAHTRPEANASTRVLRKCGFVHIGEIIDPEDGPVWRWERSPQHIGTP